MNTRTTGQAGFTLIELLVTLSLIGIVLGAVSLAIGDGGEQRQLREEAIKLQRWLQQTQQSAVVGSKILALDFQDNNQLLPLQYWDKRWQINQSILSRYALDARIKLQLVTETPESIGDAVSKTAIVFFPDGEVSPFELRIGYAGEPAYRLSNRDNVMQIVQEDI